MGDTEPAAGSDEATRLPERVVTAIMPRLRGKCGAAGDHMAMGAAA